MHTTTRLTLFTRRPFFQSFSVSFVIKSVDAATPTQISHFPYFQASAPVAQKGKMKWKHHFVCEWSVWKLGEKKIGIVMTILLSVPPTRHAVKPIQLLVSAHVKDDSYLKINIRNECKMRLLRVCDLIFLVE